ncbi:helix-turn-helix domain-containing protein [Nonomuraea sp. NPDC049784]|uniref:helix-turn-helix domain-containing protein n=1 Tax=Nonomuraea sp. NPDC049784 TaxID=3154361 RepID=UPI0033EBF66A
MQIKPRVRITGAERAQLAQHIAGRYQAGEPIRALALSIGRSYGFVHQLLEEAGVDLRRRGGDNRKATTEATTSTGAEQ